MIIGVGCGNSYSISNPTRIFTGTAFEGASARIGYETLEYKPLSAFIPSHTAFAGKKAIAYWRICAQACTMSEKSGCFARGSTAQ
jgi:hypothetical protein